MSRLFYLAPRLSGLDLNCCFLYSCCTISRSRTHRYRHLHDDRKAAAGPPSPLHPPHTHPPAAPQRKEVYTKSISPFLLDCENQAEHLMPLQVRAARPRGLVTHGSCAAGPCQVLYSCQMWAAAVSLQIFDAHQHAYVL